MNKKNEYLLSAQQMLKKQGYHTAFRDANLLEVSQSRKDYPFLYLVIEKDQFPGIAMCISLDFNETYVIADLTIKLMHIAPVALGEIFYRSNDGKLFWSDDAIEYFTLENDKDFLKNLSPLSKAFN